MSRKFYDLGNLKKHLSRRGLDEFKYVCDRTNCGSRYISQEGLQKRIVEHATGKTPTPYAYACKHCGANFDLEVVNTSRASMTNILLKPITSLRESRKKTFFYVN
jgi:hypothetical protein